jgi:hypothetical protein
VSVFNGLNPWTDSLLGVVNLYYDSSQALPWDVVIPTPLFIGELPTLESELSEFSRCALDSFECDTSL